MMKVTTDKVDGIVKSIERMKNARIMVGIPSQENNRNDGSVGNAQIGYINEYGSPAHNIPARPFLIPGVEAIKAQAADILAEGAKDVMDDKSITKSLTKAGIIAQNSVKRAITKGENFKPLEDSTIAARKRKGVSGKKPLIRTGQLRNSITYIVKER